MNEVLNTVKYLYVISKVVMKKVCMRH